MSVTDDRLACSQCRLRFLAPDGLRRHEVLDHTAAPDGLALVARVLADLGSPDPPPDAPPQAAPVPGQQAPTVDWGVRLATLVLLAWTTALLLLVLTAG